LAILLNPLVNFGKRKRIPAWLTVATVYIMVLILIFFILGTFIPLLIDYISIGITGFVKWLQDIQIAYTNEGISAFHLPYVVERGLTFLVGENKVEGIFNLLQANAKEIQAFLAEQAKNITSGTVNIGSSVIGFLSTFIFVGIATFLLVLERREV
jgi:predicted PurR-regulated permease PerM